jgi:hypothetical protein
MHGLDTRLYPRVAAYLAHLPRGVDSFPEATGKVSVVRSFIESTNLELFEDDRCPPAVAQLIRSPPPHSSWVSEVTMMAAFFALADHKHLSGAAAERWMYEQNKALLDSRMYRALVALAGPSLLMRGVQLRWNAFHRGSSLEIVEQLEKGTSLRMRFPQGVFDEFLLNGFAGAMRASLELSRARSVVVRLVEHTPRSALFHGSWE